LTACSSSRITFTRLDLLLMAAGYTHQHALCSLSLSRHETLPYPIRALSPTGKPPVRRDGEAGPGRRTRRSVWSRRCGPTVPEAGRSVPAGSGDQNAVLQVPVSEG
jgi:hypothetical protein